MASPRVDVAWCPAHPDRFLLVGGDLRLYEVAAGDAPTREAGRDVLPGAALLSTCADFQFLRCFSCYLNPNSQLLLAVGQDDGKVSLAGFGRSFNDTDWVGKEFAPKQPRRCNVVAWNPVEFSLLAAGLDKHKGDHCILVWDLNHLPGQTELGFSESTQSFSWFFHQPRSFVCGMNNKHLKIFDTRDSSRSSGTTTKASGGVCVDPFSEHRIASFHANQLVLWDVRNFEKPVTTQTENGQIVKIAWSPTRSHLMGVLTRDSGVVKLYDVQQSPAEDLEPTLVERSVQPYPGAVLSSFCWHPQHENRMLAVTPDSAARDYTVLDRITLNWSPSCELIWMRGKKLAHCWGDRDRGYDCLDDTAVRIRRRALLNYGLEPEDLWRNAELCDGDGHLRGIWSWLELVRSLEESGMRGRRGECAGVRALLGPDPSSLEGPSRGPLGPTYHSRERERVLWLCGWKAKHDGLPGNIFHRRLEKEANYARKAAIHMFNLRLKEAVAVLRDAATTGKGSSVGLVALALSGYSKETREAWREVWHSLRLSLSEPYLQALFAFLTAQDDSYRQLLYECDMAVEDRVAFACLHLPDSKLTQYIGDLTNSLVAEGNLDAVLLTGLGEDGVELVQRYLDRTGDVQTASLVALQSHPSVLSVSPRAQLWVDHYRHLLDQWRLWQQRCQFDCQWVRQHASSVPPPQVVVSCNFCGLAATPYLPLGAQGRAPPRPHLGAPTLNKTKVSCCPSCRKPLPRCALCLTNMGTPAGSLWKKGDGDWPPRDPEGRPDPAEEEKLSGLSTWFTWCQSCRHGGHAVHLADWFGDHTECPVTGCSCKCGAMDRID
ncbi:GATOR complex protein MIOS [Ixodes scapularis]|uniref:GATOR complex protein MIOS n=1 Tax=Ixodes scapularis TaxID=6945 RepID=UPI001A9E350A|nr:GATOR complex protein MIOS [Ixodes scapularis]XP_040355093.1 GATOR complex protein MIOS [Ixodes scapularis]